jgi:hypothetical protein
VERRRCPARIEIISPAGFENFLHELSERSSSSASDRTLHGLHLLIPKDRLRPGDRHGGLGSVCSRAKRPPSESLNIDHDPSGIFTGGWGNSTPPRRAPTWHPGRRSGTSRSRWQRIGDVESLDGVHRYSWGKLSFASSYEPVGGFGSGA